MPKHIISFQTCIFIVMIIFIVIHNNHVPCWPKSELSIWHNNMILIKEIPSNEV